MIYPCSIAMLVYQRVPPKGPNKRHWLEWNSEKMMKTCKKEGDPIQGMRTLWTKFVDRFRLSNKWQEWCVMELLYTVLALPDFNRKLQIPMGTAGPQLRAPDVSEHCRIHVVSFVHISTSFCSVVDAPHNFDIASVSPKKDPIGLYTIAISFVPNLPPAWAGHYCIWHSTLHTPSLHALPTPHCTIYNYTVISEKRKKTRRLK